MLCHTVQVILPGYKPQVPQSQDPVRHQPSTSSTCSVASVRVHVLALSLRSISLTPCQQCGRRFQAVWSSRTGNPLFGSGRCQRAPQKRHPSPTPHPTETRHGWGHWVGFGVGCSFLPIVHAILASCRPGGLSSAATAKRSQSATSEKPSSSRLAPRPASVRTIRGHQGETPSRRGPRLVRLPPVHSS